YLGGRRRFVEVRVGLVFKLKSAPGSRHFRHRGPGRLDRALHAVLLRSANDRRTEATHQDALLFRIAFRDKKRDLVAAIDTDERKSYARIARCGLENLR